MSAMMTHRMQRLICCFMLDRLLELTETRNGEADVRLHSVIVHEIETGYAQCFRKDAANPRMGRIALDDIVFSSAIVAAWPDSELFARLCRGERFFNPEEV